MKVLKKKSIILVIILIFLVISSNTVYYFIEKNSLENEMVNKLISQAQQINISLERSRTGGHFIEDLVGENLRSASLAIQGSISPEIEKVTNEQLDELSKKLNLKDITLLKKNKDDISLYKSSYRKEIGFSTKTWGLWYQAFNQLFADKNVTLNWGQRLPNFWSGPYSVSSSNSKEVNKYGYYYDGTTNYLINPFITNKIFKDYELQVGIESIIEDSIKLNPSILEISGINPSTFGNKIQPVSKNNVGETFTSRYYFPIFFGTYNYKSEEKDTILIKQAIATKKAVSYSTTVNGKHVFKTFTPVFTNQIDDLMELPNKSGEDYKRLNYYVMGLTIDFQVIKAELNKTLLKLLLIVVIVILICISLLLIFNRVLNKSKDELVDFTQSTYVDDINQLFDSIRAQRHDFLNHISTIHGLVEFNERDELKKYTEEMLGAVYKTNEIINIGNPAVAALIQTKSILSERKDISFSHEFESMDKFPSGVKSIDFVCIMGNLIDNAFDESMKYPIVERNVELKGWVENDQLQITIENPGIISKDQIDHIFQSGYSTKTVNEHHGLGLKITSDILKKYNGKILVDDSITNSVKFLVSMPI